MSDFEHEIQVPATAEGERRRAEWMAGLKANAANMTQATMQAHEQDHNVVTAGQAGIFGPGMTGQRMAADVAAREVRIGDAWGQGRVVERLGGTFNETEGPAPARVDLRYAHQPGGPPTGMSPLAEYMKGRNQ